MKTHCRCLIPLLGLIALLPVGLAAEKNDSPPPAKTEKGEIRVYTNRTAKDLPKEPVTFLGVETVPASPTLVAQLDKEMRAAAKRLEFEKAGELRDRIADLERRRLGIVDTQA